MSGYPVSVEADSSEIDLVECHTALEFFWSILPAGSAFRQLLGSPAVKPYRLFRFLSAYN